MKRWRLLLALLLVGAVAVYFLSWTEYTYEFDAMNLRLRDCTRYCFCGLTL